MAVLGVYEVTYNMLMSAAILWAAVCLSYPLVNVDIATEKTPLFIGKLTISRDIFNIKL